MVYDLLVIRRDFVITGQRDAGETVVKA